MKGEPYADVLEIFIIAPFLRFYVDVIIYYQNKKKNNNHHHWKEHSRRIEYMFDV